MSGNAPNLPESMEYCSSDGCFSIVPGGGDCGAVHCPGCGQAIVVTEDPLGYMVECGGRGEGSCDAANDLDNPALLDRIVEAQSDAIAHLKGKIQEEQEPDTISLLCDAEEKA